jgi:oligopeptide/dipeptide ABC transporter ATP-binding protein
LISSPHHAGHGNPSQGLTPLLAVEGLVREFAVGGRSFRAVDDVSFQVDPGETLGLVGESGCGKTTVGRLILRLLPATAGRIVFDGRDVTRVPERRLRDFRGRVQAVFQDPYSSLNPRLIVRDIVGEPLRNFGATRRAASARVSELLDIVGLPPDSMTRHPHAFSGGQRQRIGIARALALGPRLLVCDEAASSLDVSVQAQVLNLLADLQRQLGLSLLFISHNLAVVRHVSHRVAVMYLGRLVEVAPEAALFDHPRHPYTRALLAAIPEPSPDAAPPAVLSGEIPSPLDPPTGCRFQTRCPRAEARCRAAEPSLAEEPPGHWVRCYFPEPEPLRRTA